MWSAVKLITLSVSVIITYFLYNDYQLTKRVKGKRVANLILENVYSGKKRLLWDYEGPVMLVFFETNSVFNALELKKIRNYVREGAVTKEGFIFINVNTLVREHVREFISMEAPGLTGAIISEKGPKLNIKIDTLPTYVFVDHKYRILKAKQGVSLWILDDLNKYVYEN